MTRPTLSTNATADLDLGDIETEAARRKERKEAQEGRRQFRRHPIRTLLRDAAVGHRPSADELDALGLSATAKARVDAAATKVAATYEAGQNAQAREAAEEAAEDVWSALPAEQQAADYLVEIPDDPSDPAALAERVRR